MEMHEGRIDIRSPGPGQGTEVEIRLPISGGAGRGQSSRTNSRRWRLRHNLRVLIVEDNLDAAEMLELAVSHLGHVTRLAHDGATAVAAREAVRAGRDLPRHRPAGDERLCGRANVARTAGVQPRHIAAVTGWGQEEDRRKAREAGFDSHFTKPLSPAVLEDVLATIAQRMVSGRGESSTPRTRRRDSGPAF